jgi:glyoxylase-like metal-dependent hydrolase (beta-lactamase superfamily II)
MTGAAAGRFAERARRHGAACPQAFPRSQIRTPHSPIAFRRALPAWRLAPGFLAVPTPGHTRGHCALLYDDRFLFTGGHLDWDRNRHRLPASEDYCWYSWPEQIESVRRLADYRFEWVLPGHGRRVRLPAAEVRAEVLRLAESMNR